MCRLRFLQIAKATVLAALCAAALSAGAAEPTLDEFLGRDRAIEAKLQMRLSVTWQGVTLQSAIDRLQQASGVTIWFDRQVDPALSIELSANDATVTTIAEQMLSAHGLQLHPLGPVMLVASTANGQQARTALAASRLRETNFGSAAAAEWPRLATPRQLIEQVATAAGVTITNPETIRHDLLPAGKLPAMPVTDRLTLLLLRVGQTWKPDPANSQSIAIEPLADLLPLRRDYRLTANNREKILAAVAAMNDVKSEQRGNTLTLEATIANHDALAPIVERLPRPSMSSKRKPGEQKFTLTLTGQSTQQVLTTLAERLGKSLDTSPVDAERLERRLSLSVEQVTLEELLDKLGQQAGIVVDASSDTWRVTPR